MASGFHRFCWFIIPLFMVLVLPSRGAHLYVLTAIDTPGANGRASAINHQGWVVGEAETESGEVQAFVWRPETGLQMLGTLGGHNSRAYDINRRGLVVGEATDTNGITLAFCWDEKQGMRKLPVTEKTIFSAAYAVNDAGQIVGSMEDHRGMHAVMWRSDKMIILPRLPGSGNIQPLDINQHGDVAGHIKTGSDESFGSHAFYFPAAVVARNLTSFRLISPHSGSAAVALNNFGETAGYTIQDHARVQAFRYNRREGLMPLEDDGAIYSTALDINDNGQVVGSYISSYDSDETACAWFKGRLLDLNALTDKPGDWFLIQATGVNASGHIVGNGLSGDQSRAFLLAPADGP